MSCHYTYRRGPRWVSLSANIVRRFATGPRLRSSCDSHPTAGGATSRPTDGYTRPAASIEQVLAPAVVALAQEPHQMPAGVQAEGTRRAGQLHARFIGRAAAFAIVAGMAAGHQVLPRSFTGARARDHVIEGQVTRWQRLMAVLAGIAVAHEDVLARKGTGLVRNAPVFEQAYDRRHAQMLPCRMNVRFALLLGGGDALQHQHQRAAGRAHVDRLITGIQNEDRL